MDSQIIDVLLVVDSVRLALSQAVLSVLNARGDSCKSHLYFF